MPTLFTPAFVRFLNAKAFDESAHPRGQPENAGQFAPSEGAREAVEKARSRTESDDPGLRPEATTSGGLPHEEVVARAESLKNEWRYHGNFDVKNEQGELFERGGVTWLKGGHCVLETGEVLIHSPGLSAADTDKIVTHEMMHGTYEAVFRQYEQERKEAQRLDIALADQLIAAGVTGRDLHRNDNYRLRMDGDLKEEYAKEFPTFFALQQFEDDARHIDSLKKEDGVTDYSKAYWKDFEDGKCTFHIAVHETLAEMASVEAATGKVEGGKVFKKFYKTVRSRYKKMAGKKRQTGKKAWEQNREEDRFVEHVAYFDQELKPCDPEDAYFLRAWHENGTSDWAVREGV